MAGKEGQPGFLRRLEPKVEKVGGTVVAVLGILAWEIPAIAGGVLLYLFGRARTPRSQTA